jgi:Tfp pilus assembly protein PilN
MFKKQKKEDDREVIDIRLNLLPPEKKEDVARSYLFKQILKFQFIILVSMACFLGVLFTFKYVSRLNYSSRLAAFSESEKAEQYKKINDFDDKFKTLNEQINNVMQVSNGQIYWSLLFKKISNLVFPGVTVDAISTNDYAITLNGTAASRDDLVLFKEKLENESCFSQVDLPISDLVNKDNVGFQIDFLISADCLKPEDN